MGTSLCLLSLEENSSHEFHNTFYILESIKYVLNLVGTLALSLVPELLLPKPNV
jgi:hypothetical protein